MSKPLGAQSWQQVREPEVVVQLPSIISARLLLLVSCLHSHCRSRNLLPHTRMGSWKCSSSSHPCKQGIESRKRRKLLSYRCMAFLHCSLSTVSSIRIQIHSLLSKIPMIPSLTRIPRLVRFEQINDWFLQNPIKLLKNN